MSQIARLMQQINGKEAQDAYAVMATVTDIDAQTLTCTVVPLDNRAPVPNVPLQGIVVQDAWLLLPKEGSKVVAVFTSPKSASIVCLTELEKALLYADEIEFCGPGGQPLVLGDSLNEMLEDAFGHFDSFLGNVSDFCTTQSAASQGVLAPLASGFTVLGSQAATVRSRLSTTMQTINNHLSEKATTL